MEIIISILQMKTLKLKDDKGHANGHIVSRKFCLFRTPVFYVALSSLLKAMTIEHSYLHTGRETHH